MRRKPMSRSITEIIDYARLAPSVHNVQPWRFSLNENEITVFVEQSRMLHIGDQTRRELWISMGICIEAVLTAAEGLGFDAGLNYSQAEHLDKPIAVIKVSFTGKEKPELLKLLENRHSYRETLAPTQLPKAFAAQSRQALETLTSTDIIITHDESIKTTVADMANRGMKIALSSSEFRRELVPLLHTNWSRAKTGLHGFVMGLNWLGSLWQKISLSLGVDTGRQGKADRRRVLEASELIFIVSKGDVGPYWLEAGRAYLKIALLLTHHNLAHSTITAPIEGGRFHEDIEKMLGTNKRLLCLLRVGKATVPVKRTSPRLSTEELIAP